MNSLEHDIAGDKNADRAERPLLDRAKTGAKGFVNRFLLESENLRDENRLLKFLAVASFLAAFVLSIIVGFQSQRTRIIVAPFGGSSPELLIVGNQPSTEYIAAIARNIVSLTGTFTASSAEHQFNEVLKFVHPSVYDKLRDDWKTMVEGLRQYREVSFATYVMPQKPIEVYGNRIRVTAQRSRFIGDRVAEDTGVVEIGYVVENGRFWIKSVDFVPSGGVSNDR